MPNVVKKKRCTKCNQMLSFDSFQKDKNRKYGLTFYCKTCRKEIARTKGGRALEKKLSKSTEFGWVSIQVGKARERSKKKIAPLI